jgi:hypothetical protein
MAVRRLAHLAEGPHGIGLCRFVDGRYRLGFEIHQQGLVARIGQHLLALQVNFAHLIAGAGRGGPAGFLCVA